MKYCRRLRYMEKPDYYYLKNLFRTVMKQNKFKKDYVYNWDVDKEEMYKTIQIQKTKKFQKKKSKHK